MTRNEQIKQATAAYQAKLLGQGYNPVAADNCADGFHEGALWADINPQWHKYPDECPPRMGQSYIGCDENGCVLELCYTNDGNWNLDFDIPYDYNVIAWIELPEPPKFD